MACSIGVFAESDDPAEYPSGFIGDDKALSLAPVKNWAASLHQRYFPDVPVQRVSDAIQQMRDVLTGRDVELHGDRLAVAAETLRSDSATPREMMTSLSRALEQQQQINEVNGQMVRLNAMVNVANFVRHQRAEEAIVQGRQAISHLSSHVEEQAETIGHLECSVGTLSQEVAVQRQVAGRLQQTLQDQEQVLQESIHKSRQELQRQDTLLRQQQQLVQRLFQRKLKQDCVIDCGLALASLWLVNTVLIDLPLSLLLAIIPKERYRDWLRQCFKVILATRLFRFVRPYAIYAGAHSGQGALGSYVGQGLAFGTQVLRFLVTRAQARIQSARAPCSIPPGDTSLD